MSHRQVFCLYSFPTSQTLRLDRITSLCADTFLRLPMASKVTSFTFRLETPGLSPPAWSRPLLPRHHPHVPSLAKSHSSVDSSLRTSSLILCSDHIRHTWGSLNMARPHLRTTLKMQQALPGTAFFSAWLSVPFLQNSSPASLIQDRLPDHPQHTPGWGRRVLRNHPLVSFHQRLIALLIYKL